MNKLRSELTGYLLNTQGLYVRALDDCSRYAAGNTITELKNWTGQDGVPPVNIDPDSVFLTNQFAYYMDGVDDAFYKLPWGYTPVNQNGYLTFFFNIKTGRLETGASQSILNYGPQGDPTGYLWFFIATNGTLYIQYTRSDTGAWHSAYISGFYSNDNVEQKSIAMKLNYNADPMAYRYSINGGSILSASALYGAVFPIPTSNRITILNYYSYGYGLKGYCSDIGCFWNYNASDQELIRISKNLYYCRPL